ncbi:MAG: hypothetical protein ACRDU5_20560 [Mycobacterium sp.]
MTTAGTMHSPDSSIPDDVALQSSEADGLVMVHSCNRLGRHANPPHFSFADWLPVRRRR